MNIKKSVQENILKMLNNELIKCNNKIRDNKYQFKKLTEEQTLFKRERVMLTELINQVTGRFPKGNNIDIIA